MKTITVEFCEGCGRVCDRLREGGESDGWVEARLFQESYGFTWEDLDLVHTACPECRTLFEVGGWRRPLQVEAAS